MQHNQPVVAVGDQITPLPGLSQAPCSLKPHCLRNYLSFKPTLPLRPSRLRAHLILNPPSLSRPPASEPTAPLTLLSFTRPERVDAPASRHYPKGGATAMGAREYLESTAVLPALHDGMCAMAKVKL